MMRRLLLAVVLLCLTTAAAGCGASQPPPAELEPSPVVAESTPTSTSEPASPTPVPATVVLATPTPKPAPPTPTPLPPTVTPADQTADTPAGPAVTEIMIEIPAGPFSQGSDSGDPEDAPAHSVDVAAFEIDKFEVTNADFSVFAESTGYQTFAETGGYSSWRDEWSEDNHPVVRVTWDDALAYCEWLGKRLPTEAEWEKAARGDDARAYPWGDAWDPARANVKETGQRGPLAVGSFGGGESPYGLADMTGNVWEWTADWYQPYPGNTTEDVYYGEQFRVTRGGGWFDEAPQATTFNRNAADPSKTANDDLGFRCAR